MDVTYETILITLVRKDARIVTLEAELAAAREDLAEAQRALTAARLEAENLLALREADDDDGGRDTDILDRG